MSEKTQPDPSPPRNPDGTFARQEHSTATKQLARELGLSDEEIDASTPAELRKIVDITGRRALQMKQQRSEDASMAQMLERRPAQPEAVTEKIDWGKDEEGKALDESAFHSGLAGIIKSLHARVRALEEGHKQVSSIQQENIRLSFAARADREFNKLPDMKHLFGEGRGTEMEQDSPELARRKAILSEAGRLAGPSGSNDQLIRNIPKAIKLLYPEAAKPSKPAEPEETREQKAWREAGAAVPTQRAPAPESKGTRRAEKAVAAFQRDVASANGAAETGDDFDL